MCRQEDCQKGGRQDGVASDPPAATLLDDSSRARNRADPPGLLMLGALTTSLVRSRAAHPRTHATCVARPGRQRTQACDQHARARDCACTGKRARNAVMTAAGGVVTRRGSEVRATAPGIGRTRLVTRASVICWRHDVFGRGLPTPSRQLFSAGDGGADRPAKGRETGCARRRVASHPVGVGTHEVGDIAHGGARAMRRRARAQAQWRNLGRETPFGTHTHTAEVQAIVLRKPESAPQGSGPDESRCRRCPVTVTYSCAASKVANGIGLRPNPSFGKPIPAKCWGSSAVRPAAAWRARST